MPQELIVLGSIMLFGAWFVIDQRSLKDKMIFLLLLLFLYVGYQWLSGRTLSEIFSPVTQFLHYEQPPSSELE